jgi:hypothetical protein
MRQVAQLISIRTGGKRECDNRRGFVFANDYSRVSEYVLRDGSEGINKLLAPLCDNVRGYSQWIFERCAFSSSECPEIRKSLQD